MSECWGEILKTNRERSGFHRTIILNSQIFTKPSFKHAKPANACSLFDIHNVTSVNLPELFVPVKEMTTSP